MDNSLRGAEAAVVGEILSKVREEGRTALLTPEAESICASYGIPIVTSYVVATKGEACRKAEELGFPVALKVLSSQILHKTDAGGVLVGIRNEDELEKGFEKIIDNAEHYSPNATILGVLVQRMVRPGIEVMVGGLRDPQFGPTILFGVGGIFTELLKDATFGILPLDEAEAYRMIRSIKAYPLLTGYRNLPKANEKSIVDIMLKASKLLSDYTEIDQMDLNPTVVNEDGAIVVDARILLRP
jgi:acyl-CoA synthetase (NDP forming)